MKTMLALAMLGLWGCAASPVVDDAGRVACQAFRPITYSMFKDTSETVEQIRGHNAAYKSLCQ